MKLNFGVTTGMYKRDFYLIPTVVIHNGDFYHTMVIAWCKWFVGIVW